mmetsp:Transcript_53140/g.172821  ORF Transcript_53140/g.172821 Transcript_53140/m.172821 type:complete len:211 (-) Transcript_53140:347-979(-)
MTSASRLPESWHANAAAKGRTPGNFTSGGISLKASWTTPPLRFRTIGPVAQSEGGLAPAHGVPVPLFQRAQAAPAHHASWGCHWKRWKNWFTCHSTPAAVPLAWKCRANIPHSLPSCAQLAQATRKPPNEFAESAAMTTCVRWVKMVDSLLARTGCESVSRPPAAAPPTTRTQTSPANVQATATAPAPCASAEASAKPPSAGSLQKSTDV